MNAAPKQTSTLAIISLIAGLLGWTFAPLLGSLGAIACGHLARSEIRRAPDRIEGDGLAITGLILGWAQIILITIVFLAIVLFFGGLAAVLAWAGSNAPLAGF